MARRVIEVPFPDAGRDSGKTYVITEMNAAAAEKWGMRALNAMSKAMGGFDENMLRAGLPGLTAVALSAFARAHFEEIEPLFDDMFRCITIKTPSGVVRALVEDDIEEVATRVKLREEVLELHLGFFKAAVRWIMTVAKQTLEQPADPTPSNTPTSPGI